MLSEYGTHLLDQAKRLGMLNEGYAWLVTEGMTTYSAPEQFEGLLGTSPGSGNNLAYSLQWTVSNVLFFLKLVCLKYVRTTGKITLFAAV